MSRQRSRVGLARQYRTAKPVGRHDDTFTSNLSWSRTVLHLGEHVPSFNSYWPQTHSNVSTLESIARKSIRMHCKMPAYGATGSCLWRLVLKHH